MKSTKNVSHVACRLQISRSLIICGVLFTTSWWAYFVSVALSALDSTSTGSVPRNSSIATEGQHVSNEVNSYSLPTHGTTGNSFDARDSMTRGDMHNRSDNTPTRSSHNMDAHLLNQSAPLTALIYPLHAKSGTYHAYLYIGTPPQRQTLIVDTGSRLTAFPCHPHCPDCGPHTTKPFHLDQSSTYRIVSCEECRLDQADFPLEDYFAGDEIGGNSGDGGPPPRLRSNKQVSIQRRNIFPNSCAHDRCEVDQRYTEGSSWRAFEVEDNVWLGFNETTKSVDIHDKFSAPFVFGCQISEQGLFKSQYADGIMGLSMYTQTLFDTWFQSGSIAHRSFSLCLNRDGGLIALGGTALTHEQEWNHSRKMHLSPMQFTPFAKENVWYYTVTVTSISVGMHMLPAGILQFVNDHKGTIIDSGTTDTFISHKVAKSFISAWQAHTGRTYNNRLQHYTHEQFINLPVVTFELLGGIAWEITPEAYMEAEDQFVNETSDENTRDPTISWEGKRGFISRIYIDEPQGVVLGSNAMTGKELYFDTANRRMGVAKATC